VPNPILIVPGTRFGRLTLIRRAGSDSAGVRWECKCDCGKITQPLATHLQRGCTQSCGCLQKELTSKRNAKDITGQRFGRLVVLHRTGKRRKGGSVVWRCRCDCGRDFETITGELGRRAKSCGCWQRELVAQLNYRHGGRSSSLYTCWAQMKYRCLNPKCKSFKNYGGRGITFAPEWIDFIPFRDYVNQHLGPKPSPKHSIDRIENSEGYFPGNLKWSTSSQQKYNSRRSKINKITDATVLKYTKGTKRRSAP
jgi:hypothetical protein